MKKNLQRRLRAILRSLGLLQIARSTYRNHINRKYGAIRQFEVTVGETPMTFSTEDAYSRGWFFPRYEGGKIHEQPVSEAIVDSLKGARCFVDVGTNLGWYTVLAAKHLKEGAVIGFEMDDLNVDLLRKNVALNHCDNIEIHHAAVSNEPGTISYQRSSAAPSAVFSISSGDGSDGEGEMVSVESVTLDGFFSDRQEQPDVIKIDVEGAETMVLNGMKRILGEVKPSLFVEVHPTKLPSYGSSVAEVVSILMDHGYEIFEMEEMRSFEGGGAARKLERDSLRKLGPDTEVAVTSMLYAQVPAAV